MGKDVCGGEVIQKFLDYIAIEKRYSVRTVGEYGDDLKSCGAIYLTDEILKVFEEIIGKENITEVIEPSAGCGNFSLQISNCMAYDIEPEHEGIIKQDFSTANHRIIICILLLHSN